MPFLKNEKYPNNDTNQYEENDNEYDVYYNSGSPDFNVSYHSDIDAAGQFKYENNNNNFYPNNIFNNNNNKGNLFSLFNN